jgi:hypothetical protein
MRLGELAEFFLQFQQVPVVIALDAVLAGVDVGDLRRRVRKLTERQAAIRWTAVAH